MNYISTRGAWHDDPQPFRAILLEGLAPDGGLAVPQQYPRFTAAELAALRGASYPDLAVAVLSRYITDMPIVDLRRIVSSTYTAATFGSEEITPLSTLEPGVHLLHVSNGPTLAFKDIALQLLGSLFEHALRDEHRVLNILGATSGDTGSSAEYAMRGKRNIAVFMLSPHGRMSAFQQAQMYSLDDPNIHNLAVDGTFDDCQDIVKALSADTQFKCAHSLGAVNSINWARIAAQVVYYFKGYFAATTRDGQPVSFAVPSGNFGNVLAGHVAKAMGLPIAQLIVATNENDVLDEFFRGGRYRPRGAAETHATSSPSMDISKASNFERYMFDIVDRDPARLRELWRDLERGGGFDVAGTPLWERVGESGFASGRSTHADRLATIRDVHARCGALIDPHTADGIKVGRELRQPDVPLVCIETALPAKFSATIREAVGFEPPRPSAYADLESRPQRCTVVAADPSAVAAIVAKYALASVGAAPQRERA
ncbi:MAG: threonine synthase [Betaproteobacteria bacterium]|nr:threonine synthase [Betaproteobacteria bacterium]MDE2358902.1 threonine synthase [Betaproteobacteria bacterium]